MVPQIESTFISPTEISKNIYTNYFKPESKPSRPKIIDINIFKKKKIYGENEWVFYEWHHKMATTAA